MRQWISNYLLPVLNKRVADIANWVTFISLLPVAAMTWLVSQLSFIAAYGWAAIVLCGIGAACLVLLAVTGSLALYRYYHPLRADHEIRPLSAESGPSSVKDAVTATSQQLYLKDAHLYSGSDIPPSNPRFVAKFARAGKWGRLYVDDRYIIAGLGAQVDIHNPRLFLSEYRDFVSDESIDIAVLTHFNYDGRKMWRWGSFTDHPDVKTTFVSSAWHRCRLAFICDDEPPQFFYFIIDLAPSEVAPNLIGYDRFGFVQEWEAENV